MAIAVQIRDQKLKDAIKKTLGKSKAEEITAEDMLQLIELDCQFNSISDLTGIEQAANLSQLNLKWNNVKDLTPLIRLSKLKELNLTGNGLGDATPLGKLTNLQSLELDSNKLVDLTFVEELGQLSRLSLARNRLEVLSPLASAQSLRELVLDYNKIQDLKAIIPLNSLVKLSLKNNMVEDVTPLAHLANLEELSLWSNQLSDISPLANLTSLRELYLQNNKIADITPLKNMEGLERLHLDSNRVADIGVLAGLIHLKALGLWRNPIKDMVPLKALDKLTGITLTLPNAKELPELEGYPETVIMEVIQQFPQFVKYYPKESLPLLVQYLKHPDRERAITLLTQEPAAWSYLSHHIAQEEVEQLLAERLTDEDLSFDYFRKFLFAPGLPIAKKSFVAQKGGLRAQHFARQLEEEVVNQIRKSPKTIGQNLELIAALDIDVIEVVKEQIAASDVSKSYITELLLEKHLKADKIALIGAFGSREAKVMALDFQLSLGRI